VVSTPARPLLSIDVTTYVWQGFLQEATQKWPVNDFAVPGGLVKAKVDVFTGLRPAAGSKSIDEWFIPGTEPKDTIPAGQCGEVVLTSPGVFEGRYSNWMSADLDWLARAKKGPGVAGGVNRTRTAYFYNGLFQPYGRSWGALVEGRGCTVPSPSVTCYPVPTPDASGVIPSFTVPTTDPSASPVVIYEPCPTPSAPPSASPTVEPTPAPTPPPTPTPAPTPPPTPPPTPTPAPS
jgi:hypothetical protein